MINYTGKLPNHKLGVHWIPIHGRNVDMDYIKALKPSAVKLVDPDPERVRQCLEWIDPNGVVVLRDWALSEQKDDMYKDPVGTGKRHAEDWYGKITTGRFAGFDKSRLAICGINEPFVRNDAEIAATVFYTASLLKRATELGVRVLALNLSVGWPMNHDTPTVKDTPPDWGPFMGLEPLIVDNNGFLCVHEYFYRDEAEGLHNSPVGRFGWYAHRIDMCPLKSVPIIIGEWGMEKKVDEARWNAEGKPPVGWIGNMSADQFADQLWRYIDTANPNIFSVMPFTSDYNHDWYPMDVAGAYPQILARKHAANWSSPYPSGTGGGGGTSMSDEKLIIVPKFSGNITGFYGQDYGAYSHEGMDISAVVGTPIYAPYDGVVAWSDFEAATYGNYVRVYCPKLDACFFYGHMSDRKVQTGNAVKQGQLLGLSGNTGNSSGPHIHFEVRAMNDDGSYRVFKAGALQLVRQNGRIDPLGFLMGWLAAGNRYEER